ncbi:MAG TPA: hypothetical protein VKB78_06910 [Pirellulales bacterium]|nr:hypothetical protein [Pirellulales bacterium]
MSNRICLPSAAAAIVLISLAGTLVAQDVNGQRPPPGYQLDRDIAPNRTYPNSRYSAGDYAPRVATQPSDQLPRQDVPPRQDALRGPAPGQNAPGQNPPAPPFQLSPKEQADLDKVLDAWEQKNGAITSFKANFDHMQYDPVFLPKRQGEMEQPIQQSSGEIKYVAPDKGMIRETSGTTLVQNPKTNKLEPKKLDALQYWACDGKVLYKVDSQQKVVEEVTIPPQLQGKAITQGPLPFVFGAKASELKARYYIRPTPSNDPGQCWLEIRPKYLRDAENFSKVQIILDAKTMFPNAIEITGTNGTDRDVYLLTPKGLLDFNLPWRDDFSPSPFGYKHVKNDPQPPAAAPPAGPNGPPNAQPGQAQRYVPGVNRR